MNRVWAQYLGGHLPATTTVEVARLATHANCKLEISVIAVAEAGGVERRRRTGSPRAAATRAARRAGKTLNAKRRR
jgi:hypothetical protein